MLQIAVFVDAGYLYAQGSVLLAGQKQPRSSIRLVVSHALSQFARTAEQVAPTARLLRIYWYDGILRGGRLTAEQVRALVERDAVVIVPVASLEQHGPHLPLHTDTVVATALARELAARRRDCVVAPPLTITASGEHQGFPGTLSIGTAVMSDVLIELVRSADWSRGVVFVNGHGGNATAMVRAAATLAHESRRALDAGA